jgi:MerR family transcriptional regulator, light-induced transcriptional regulator
VNNPQSTTLTPTSDTPLFTASEVEHRTRVPATTLRQWERRYGLPNPQRTHSGYRLFSLDDIACIEFLKDKIASGVSASRAAQLYALQRGSSTQYSGTGTQINPQIENPIDTGHPLDTAHSRGIANDLVAQLVEATMNGDAIKADRVLANAHASLSVEAVLLEVIQPTLITIGEMWHRGEITVAHEHQASHYLRGKLHQLLELAGSSRHGPTVVVACAPREYHEIGSLTLAIFLRRAGFRTHYLGANTPVADLIRFSREMRADAVMISAGSPDAIDALRESNLDLREAAPVVAFGGVVFNAFPELAHEFGGEYLGSDAATALDSLLSRFAQ